MHASTVTAFGVLRKWILICLCSSLAGSIVGALIKEEKTIIEHGLERNHVFTETREKTLIQLTEEEESFFEPPNHFCRHWSYEKVEAELERMLMREWKEGTYMQEQVRRARIAQLLHRWGELAPRRAMLDIMALELIRVNKSGKVDKFAGLRKGSYMYNIIKGWASQDPIEASVYYMENKTSLRDARVLDIIVENLVKTDWKKAVEMFRSLSLKEKKEVNAACIILNLLDKDKDKMVEYIDLLNQMKKDDTIKVIKNWKDKDEASCMAWLATQDEMKRWNISAELMHDDIMNDMKKSGEAFSHMCVEEQVMYFSKGRLDLFEKWGVMPVFEWIIENAKEELVPYVLSQYMGLVRKTEFAEVEQWACSLPAGKAKERIVLGLTHQKPPTGHDMNRLFNMIQECVHSDAQEKAVYNILENMVVTDYDAALKWVEESSGWETEKKSQWKEETSSKQRTTVFK